MSFAGDNNTLISCDKFTREQKKVASAAFIPAESVSSAIVHLAFNWEASRAIFPKLSNANKLMSTCGVSEASDRDKAVLKWVRKIGRLSEVRTRLFCDFQL